MRPYKYQFTSKNSVDLRTNSYDDIDTLIQNRWGVQKFQTILVEDSENKSDDCYIYDVNLTDKLGDIFACIGTLKEYKDDGE